LEIGCGTGWLSLWLAEFGVSKIYGIDFSEEQISKAKEASREKGVENKVHFSLFNGNFADLATIFPKKKFDGLIIHALLHHLTTKEIKELMNVILKNFLSDDAIIYIFEPIKYNVDKAKTINIKINNLLSFLDNLPNAGQKIGLRKIKDEERYIREKIAARSWGVCPRGPSPKEMPFKKGELEEILGDSLIFCKSYSALSFSVSAAKNILLLCISHKSFGSLVMIPYLLTIRLLERFILFFNPNILNGWVFELMQCKVKNDLIK